MRSEDATVLNWLTRLPDDMEQRYPLLSLIHATALGGTGRTALAAARLAQVDDVQLDPQARRSVSVSPLSASSWNSAKKCTSVLFEATLSLYTKASVMIGPRAYPLNLK